VETDAGRDNASTFAGPDNSSNGMVTAAAAHELCNHLQVIDSALRLLERALHGTTPVAFDIIFSGARTSLDRANRLCRGLIDTGPSGTIGASRTSLSARLSALRETVLLAAGPCVLVEYDIGQNVPDILCVVDALDDAILNIVSNAGRAMPRGGRIAITVFCDHAARDRLPSAVLRIADNGCGMTADIAARAWEPRFTTRARGEGSGLGLAAVGSFARTAGGSAELESHPGTGTIVTIRLPGVLKDAKVSSPHSSS
jgi:signal transduction histidine kinase